MRPNFSTACLDDIQGIHDFLVAQSPSATQRFVDGIFAKVELLLTFPELDCVVPELNRAAVREVFHRHYRIIYEVKLGGRIDVVLIQSGHYPLDATRLR